MLKVSTNKAIAGYAPCSECNTLAAVHFPNGGRRANTPYLSCGGCNKTIQASTTKEHIKQHYVPTLEAYAERFDVDVSAEQEQLAANKWTENPALYEVKVNGLVEEVQSSLLEDNEPLEGEVLEAAPLQQDKMDMPGQESVTIDNDSQQVVDEEAEAKKPQERGGAIWLFVLLAVLLFVSVGGYCLIKRSKRKAVEAQAKQEVKANE
ncbi:hypothetical protein L1D13_10860 [Vibrio tubiashii]|uniref:hypothetical protein n=1 Tax=Vibrio tubiashii TaxID=29498 RepID=UPI001EFC37B3|nr:hypothetical protein [Vibrio tubiashii]MCG9584630.1 hypothetical protein [Vibrio tubiashii]MCG9618158.1 hypothetical protein [Vibrio tubiashii]MCG9687423.1 hypothetical protein [Vibrio tubiashii]